MDKLENRDQFIEDLWKIAKLVKMTDRFKNSLERHKQFGKYIKSVEKLRNPDQMKIFVLLELTKDRESCNEVIRLLEECQQNEAALKLKSFNEVVGAVKMSDEAKLDVKRVSAPQLRVKSSIIGLSGNPRGKCVIVNLMEEQQTPNYRDRFGNLIHCYGLKNQTIQFSYVFSQMFFDVFTISDANVNELKQRLHLMSKNKNLEDSEAFVLIVISYGQKQQILGSDAIQTLRDIRFGVRNGVESDHKTKADDKLKTDVMSTKEVIALFSDKSCPALKSKPKLFLFNCCQVPDYSEKVDLRSVRERDVRPDEYGPDVLLSYSCARGYSCFYNPFTGLSYYGQALCQTLAQYACEDSLETIVNRTTHRLEILYEEEIRKDPNILKNSYDNELTKYNSITKQVYFNPGFYEN